MPSYTPNSTSTSTSTTTTTTTTQQASNNKPDLETLISTSLSFIRNDFSSIHPSLPSLISTLISSGAADCWHKHSSFFSHLLSVHRILSLWSSPSHPLPLAGLFHSAYSNSYVNLAIFPPTSSSRTTLINLLSPSVERLVHLFCVIPRHFLIHDLLLSHYPSDEELRHHLLLSDEYSSQPNPWRLKIQSVLPSHGLTVKHIRTGEDVNLSRRVIAAFLLMTMADFSDQLFSFQDELFNNDNGRLEFSGNNFTALWPGDGKPGLWMNSVSRMGALFRLIVREEEVFIEERRKEGGVDVDKERDEELELVIPPVFESCTEVLGAEEQKEGRELYWEAVCSDDKEVVERLLKKSCEKNKYVGEPHIVLGQVYLGLGKYEEAEKEVEKGLRLVLEWGSSWDKRIGWEGWVAWGRVLLMKAKEKHWPNTSWGILNLGLVR